MDQIKISYADLPLTVFLLPFFGGMVLWLREPAERQWLRLAALFGGIAFWVKQDALIGVGSGLLALAVVVWRRKIPWRPLGAALVTVVILAAPWWAAGWHETFAQ